MKLFPGDMPMTGEDTSRSITLKAFAEAWTYVGIILLGLVVRLVTMGQYVGHVDEPASLMAIEGVSQIGYPLFPSGVLYLQGALFSYLAAPLAWFLEDAALWRASRVLYLVIALTVIPLTMRLVQELNGSILVAGFVGTLVALDPNLIIWGVLIRPYGILAAETMFLLLLFTRLLRDGQDARFLRMRVVIWLPLVATMGTFTHVGFWLAFPPLALIALVVWKTRLLRSHRAILFSGIASFVPLTVFLLLGRFVGIGSGTSDGAVGSAFVGSHVFTFQYLTELPDLRWAFWTSNFFEGSFHDLMPYLITLASVILAWRATTVDKKDASGRWSSWGSATLLAVHWMTIWAVVLFVFDYPGGPYPHRYLNQVLPIGYAVLGLAARELWRYASVSRRSAVSLLHMVLIALLVLPSLRHATTAAEWRMGFSGGSADYWGASEWASRRAEPGDLVLTAMPPAAYSWFPGERRDNVRFLAGPAASLRTELYVKPTADGQSRDYWLGVPAIDSVEGLCSTLVDYAGDAWIIVDDGRLHLPWGFQGRMETIIHGASVERHRGYHGVAVRWVTAADAWTPEVRAECGL